MKIIFAGTPDFAASSLAALINAGHNIIAVYTQPDRPAGRGKKLMPSPVKKTALEHDIKVFQPLNFKEPEARQELAELDADLMIVAAYGLILPKEVLDTPKLGCINIHASLLPRWRGAAPIQRAIQAGDSETGITIMQMDVGLDTGDMLLKERCDISDTVTGGELHDELAAMGAKSILRYLNEPEDLIPEKQDDALANYAHKLSKAEAHIDWSLSSLEIERSVRAFNPWPVSYAEQDGQRIRVLSAKALDSQSNAPVGEIVEKSKNGVLVQCGNGALLITQLQLAGSKAVSAADFFNGGKAILEVGTTLN
ncbi:methionyl-tRNA formyltransferase [Oleiphilus sp. HI0009]|nr:MULTISPECIES: methionyl-tRNA formyltransferase [unclassified Oleiphilus]KZX72590.1 methionyl-tRNA formyltransferase [Oleiphilus sp. HI0009]KZY70679.1 methionyl-tRNA formyltransferase [Oleiphilus sp. HI0066]KZY71354.1 methionyl-tRNA formyltransferase [Oleiphilus sp. HI0067]MCH2158328.1 methionyl-tRNA formyltransferase [Oleiphilaceae bacterium]